MKIKYEFATLLFAQKTQKNVSPLRGLTQGILTPKGWHCSENLGEIFEVIDCFIIV
jgi:hypothetical protein